MRHGKKYKKLGRSTSHRLAMLNNMVKSLLLAGSIKTTIHKAKALRVCAERMITKVKRGGGSLVVLRSLHASFGDQRVVDALLNAAKVFSERNGGYTRVIKLMHRSSDKADMALIEFVEPVGVLRS